MHGTVNINFADTFVCHRNSPRVFVADPVGLGKVFFNEFWPFPLGTAYPMYSYFSDRQLREVKRNVIRK